MTELSSFLSYGLVLSILLGALLARYITRQKKHDWKDFSGIDSLTQYLIVGGAIPFLLTLGAVLIAALLSKAPMDCTHWRETCAYLYAGIFTIYTGYLFLLVLISQILVEVMKIFSSRTGIFLKQRKAITKNSKCKSMALAITVLVVGYLVLPLFGAPVAHLILPALANTTILQPVYIEPYTPNGVPNELNIFIYNATNQPKIITNLVVGCKESEFAKIIKDQTAQTQLTQSNVTTNDGRPITTVKTACNFPLVIEAQSTGNIKCIFEYPATSCKKIFVTESDRFTYTN